MTLEILKLSKTIVKSKWLAIPAFKERTSALISLLYNFAFMPLRFKNKIRQNESFALNWLTLICKQFASLISGNKRARFASRLDFYSVDNSADRLTQKDGTGLSPAIIAGIRWQIGCFPWLCQDFESGVNAKSDFIQFLSQLIRGVGLNIVFDFHASQIITSRRDFYLVFIMLFLFIFWYFFSLNVLIYSSVLKTI